MALRTLGDFAALVLWYVVLLLLALALALWLMPVSAADGGNGFARWRNATGAPGHPARAPALCTVRAACGTAPTAGQNRCVQAMPNRYSFIAIVSVTAGFCRKPANMLVPVTEFSAAYMNVAVISEPLSNA